MLANPATHFFPAQAMDNQFGAPRALRKRKAEFQPENNERLSKRMSLLNLEQSGAKLYIPVESQQPQQSTVFPAATGPSPLSSSTSPLLPAIQPNGNAHQPAGVIPAPRCDDGDSMMQVDDSKYKVYIRNLDDELSSESEAEDGGLIFLPDIERHLRENRIPAAILTKPDPEMLSKQLVLYSVPSSLTVPEEHDSVRKAIIEARARARERQRAERADFAQPADIQLANPESVMMTDDDNLPTVLSSGISAIPAPVPQGDDDSDVMELD